MKAAHRNFASDIGMAFQEAQLVGAPLPMVTIWSTKTSATAGAGVADTEAAAGTVVSRRVTRGLSHLECHFLQGTVAASTPRHYRSLVNVVTSCGATAFMVAGMHSTHFHEVIYPSARHPRVVSCQAALLSGLVWRCAQALCSS